MNALQPGSELDALVAEAVGWTDAVLTLEDGEVSCSLPEFSTDWNAAMRAAERFFDGWWGGYGLRWSKHAEEWTFDAHTMVPPMGQPFYIKAPTGPHAICLAILKIRGGECTTT